MSKLPASTPIYRPSRTEPVTSEKLILKPCMANKQRVALITTWKSNRTEDKAKDYEGFKPNTMNSYYICKTNVDLLPKVETKGTRAMKAHFEKKKLDLFRGEREGDPPPAAPRPPDEARAGKESFPEGTVGSPYVSKTTGQRMASVTTEKTRQMKQQLEKNKLELIYDESFKSEYKAPAQDGLVQRTAGKIFIPPGVEVCQYLSRTRCEPLSCLSNPKTEKIKQHLERNKLRLTHPKDFRDDIKCEPKQTCDVPAGYPNPPPGSERSCYLSKTSGESLPRLGSEMTQALKDKWAEHQLELPFQPLPPAPTVRKEVEEWPQAGRDASQYLTKPSNESLPKYCTATTKGVKKHIERNKLELAHPMDKVNLTDQSVILPQKTEPAGLKRPLAGTEVSQFLSRTSEGLLLHYSTPESRAVKERLERNKLQLPYSDLSRHTLESTQFNQKLKKNVPAGLKRPQAGSEILLAKMV